MKLMGSWKFRKKNIPFEERVKPKNQLPVFFIKPINTVFDCKRFIKHSTVLVCGDGGTLLEDIKRFESFGVGHDVFCANRSMLAFQRPINHWAAIDAEESVWFASNLTQDVIPAGGRILRHTIGHCPLGYDVFWGVDEDKHTFETDYQRYVWSGNSGYFAILACIEMGYTKVVVAGMPIDLSAHWYEPQDTPGPNWVGQTYRTWMDFKTTHPLAGNVRSLSGYSKFIFGEATEKWLQ